MPVLKCCSSVHPRLRKGAYYSLISLCFRLGLLLMLKEHLSTSTRSYEDGIEQWLGVCSTNPGFHPLEALIMVPSLIYFPQRLRTRAAAVIRYSVLPLAALISSSLYNRCFSNFKSVHTFFPLSPPPSLSHQLLNPTKKSQL